MLFVNKVYNKVYNRSITDGADLQGVRNVYIRYYIYIAQCTSTQTECALVKWKPVKWNTKPGKTTENVEDETNDNHPTLAFQIYETQTRLNIKTSSGGGEDHFVQQLMLLEKVVMESKTPENSGVGDGGREKIS